MGFRFILQLGSFGWTDGVYLEARRAWEGVLCLDDIHVR